VLIEGGRTLSWHSERSFEGLAMQHSSRLRTTAAAAVRGARQDGHEGPGRSAGVTPGSGRVATEQLLVVPRGQVA